MFCKFYLVQNYNSDNDSRAIDARKKFVESQIIIRMKLLNAFRLLAKSKFAKNKILLIKYQKIHLRVSNY
jgi:hypothetical protein